MAVDRGGLEYTIRVINAFSGPLRQFRTELITVRKSFNRFRRDLRSLGGEATRVVRDMDSISSAAKRLSISTEASIVASNKRGASLTRLEGGLQRVAVAEDRAASARVRSLTSIKQQNTALNTQAAVLAKTAAAQRRLGSSSRAAARGLRRAGTAAVRSQAAFGGLLLTVRRLVTTLVFFAAARGFLEGMRSLVVGTIEFAAAIETAELGIAALFTAAGQVENQFGQILTGQRALTEAQKISEDQLRRLRIAGLQTAATFDQLALAFQTGLAPGLVSGLNIDEIRQFTIQISQAASALNVEQNQLAEEIRSILAGTINLRTTRIAVALGITNEDIRRAKEAGDLFGFLQTKFAAFSTAGTRALNTFNARLTNTIDALLLVSSTGAENFFVILKDVLQDVKDSLTDINEETGELALNPEAVATFQAIFDSLENAVISARNLALELDFSEVQNALSGIVVTVNIISNTLLGVFAGSLKGASDLADIFRFIGRVVQGLTGLDLLDNETLDRGRVFLSAFVRSFLAVKGTLLVLSLIASQMGILVGLALVLAALTENTAKDTQTLADAIVGIKDASPEGVFRVLSAEAEAAFKNIPARFRLLLEELKVLAEIVFEEIGKAIGNSLVNALKDVLSDNALFGLIRSLAELSGTDSVVARLAAAFLVLGDNIENSNKESILAFDRRVAARIKEETAAIKERTDAQIEANNLVAEGVRQREIVRQTTPRGDKESGELIDNTVFDLLKAASEQAVSNIREAFADLGVSLPEDMESALEGIGKELKQFGRVVGRSAEEAEKSFSEKFFERIKQNLQEFTSSGGAFELFFRFLEDSTRRVTNLIADLIVDAFDPSSDTSARERFLNFLRELAREAIRILLRIAIAKAAALAFGDAGAAAGGAAEGQGFTSGGSVGKADRRAMNFLANFPVGFAAGGTITESGIPGRTPTGSAWGVIRGMRPRGLDPRDTIPIWVQPKEWVIRKKSSEMYGGRVMAAINRGMIDPFALRALAGQRPSVRRRISQGNAIGMVSGGSVVSAATSAAGTPAAQQGNVVGAVMVADEQAMARMVAGGRSALLEFIAEEAPTINGLLS